METMQLVREFLWWCTALNLAMLTFAALALVLAGGPIKELHGGMFDLPADDLSRAYFQYLAQYKIAIFVFNLVPYLALTIVG